MELSIIVPVYNMAEDARLEVCLESLLHQSASDFEIIVVDDASTDNTSQVLLDYAAHYPDVLKVYLSQVHGGRGRALNEGLKCAHGRWVAFAEIGGLAAPDMYEKMLKRAKDTGADMVACDYHVNPANPGELGTVVSIYDAAQTGPLDVEKRKGLLVDSGKLETKIYKRRLVRDCGMTFPENISCIEEAIEHAFILKATHFEYVAEPLYAHYTSADAEDVLEHCEHSIEAAHLMLRHAVNGGYFSTYREELEYRFIKFAYVNPMFAYLDSIEQVDLEFVRYLWKDIQGSFPNFEKNPYYKERISYEEKNLLHLQQTSTRLMLVAYRVDMFLHRMGKGGWKNVGLEVLGGVLGALLCLFFVSFSSQNEQTLKYPVVLFGDSVVANDYYGDELDFMLAAELGEAVFNGGFGGSYLCNQNFEHYSTYGDESLSMEELTDSIITGDFLVQKSVIKSVSRLDYYESRLDTLSKIDFDQTHTVIIEHGVNDYVSQIPPEQVGETLRVILEKLQKRYPAMDILVCSPTYCYIMKDEQEIYCDTNGMGAYTLEDYVLTEEQICQEMGVGFVNNYHQDIITKETLGNYSLDGLHLNEAGRQVMADNILKVMRERAAYVTGTGFGED